jgi:hypothetical protein
MASDAPRDDPETGAGPTTPKQQMDVDASSDELLGTYGRRFWNVGCG